MHLAFSPQAGDAVSYLEMGQDCASDLAKCWNVLRPMGASLFYSLPYRLGLPPTSIIILNWLLLAGSVGLMFWTTRRLDPGGRWSQRLRLAAIVAVHLAFLWATSWNSLSDLPAGIFALAGVQLMLLAKGIDRWWLYLAIGLSLGAAVSLRAFYLYPAVATIFALVLGSVRQPRRLLRRCAALVLLVPLAIQYGETYRRSQMIGFIHPPLEDLARRIHFRSTLAGYDTGFGGAIRRDGKKCFQDSHNFKDAVDKRDASALACILERRHEFYFGTYTLGGAVYLAKAAERHESTALLIMNTLVFMGALVRLAFRRRRSHSLVVGLFMLMLYAQASVIVPESRFLCVVFVWMWSDILCATIATSSCWLVRHPGHWRLRRRDRFDRSSQLHAA